MPSRNVVDQTIHRGLGVDINDRQTRPGVRASIQRCLWPGWVDEHFAPLEIDPYVGVCGAVEDMPIKSSIGVIDFQTLSRARPVTVPGHQHLAGWEDLDFVPAGSAILHANHKT